MKKFQLNVNFLKKFQKVLKIYKNLLNFINILVKNLQFSPQSQFFCPLWFINSSFCLFSQSIHPSKKSHLSNSHLKIHKVPLDDTRLSTHADGILPALTVSINNLASGFNFDFLQTTVQRRWFSDVLLLWQPRWRWVCGVQRWWKFWN